MPVENVLTVRVYLVYIYYVFVVKIEDRDKREVFVIEGPKAGRLLKTVLVLVQRATLTVRRYRWSHSRSLDNGHNQNPLGEFIVSWLQGSRSYRKHNHFRELLTVRRLPVSRRLIDLPSPPCQVAAELGLPASSGQPSPTKTTANTFNITIIPISRTSSGQ